MMNNNSQTNSNLKSKTELPPDLESRFYQFMGFDSSVLLERYKTYIPFFKNCKTVLDLGCGNGEFLQLLKQSGVEGVGVDIDPAMAKTCAQKNLNVITASGKDFLQETALRFDGIFAAHLIEHLSPHDVVELIRSCQRILNPGGVLVLVTPNPESVGVHLTEFWRDATHVRPYNLDLVRFFVHEGGFSLGLSGTNPRNFASPLADLYQPDAPYDWPPSFLEMKHKLFDLYPPPPIEKPWYRQLFKSLLYAGSRAFLRNQAVLLEDYIRRLYYHFVTLYAPNEIFVVGKLKPSEDSQQISQSLTMQSPKVSIVIPNWNGQRFLTQCFDSLQKQTFRHFETILVDNGSQDTSIEFTRSQYPWVKIISQDKNYGFSHAVNRGIEAANSEWVFLLNNDTEVDTHCVENIVRSIERYPNNSFFSCKMMNYHHRDVLDGTGDCVPRNLNAFRRGQYWRDGEEFKMSQLIFGACGGAAVYSKKALQEIGLFDEDFFCYYEDVDLSIRLQWAGHTCRYLPGSVVYHIGSATTGSTFNPFIARCLARNKIFLIVKNISFSLALKSGPVLLRGEVERALHFVKQKALVPYLLGLCDALKKMPAMFRKRRTILNRTKISAHEMFRMMKDGESWVQPDRMVMK